MPRMQKAIVELSEENFSKLDLKHSFRFLAFAKVDHKTFANVKNMPILVGCFLTSLTR